MRDWEQGTGNKELGTTRDWEQGTGNNEGLGTRVTMGKLIM